MSNTTGLTSAITPHAKRAIELYLHGIAVYAAYPERRTAEQMYEIRRVSEAFTEPDRVAYTSNDAQRQWWISAHNAFCDLMPEPSGAILPALDGKSESCSHAINHPQGSVLRDQAYHDQLDQTPKTPNENEADVLTERKNPEAEGPPVVNASVTRGFHQPSVKASTEHNHGTENAFAQPLRKTPADFSKGIKDLVLGSSFKKLDRAGKNTPRSDEVAGGFMNVDRTTQAACPSLAEQKLAMMQGSTFKEVDDAKSVLKEHLDAAVDLCTAARDGLNLQEILNEQMKRALLETDPKIRSHSLEACVRSAALVLDETKARFHETSTALLYAQMEHEALDRKIEFAQLDFIEERGKRQQAQVSLASAVDKAEKTGLENHRLKKDLVCLRSELLSKRAW